MRNPATLAGLEVARFTRAWIETSIVDVREVKDLVARFTRAWIETLILSEAPRLVIVARFTRAWIET